ncbi:MULTISPECIES: hypothetical protein [unclassified Flavobacterium]|uniref:hypothetical protein n=1 Tax=unclassified Flavobacterium TaxID=196869 RepID=UPI001F13C55B|nr:MULTISPECIES: hypothetical protein [unclassified Flavobacterium]UMY66567.1 hypothetical protein MKO97_04055 [Flavobacterium sp. HJ-32-4]
MKVRLLFYVALFSISVMKLQAQGCSDAGICSMASHPETYSSARNEIEVTGLVGAGEADTRYFSPFIAYNRRFNDRWSGGVKITSSFAEGRFGKRGSLGDAYLSAHFIPKPDARYKWSYSAAVKIPFNRANLKINEHPLPLDYQSSLGTIDFLGSVNLRYGNWDFNSALQLIVVNLNANSFFAEYSGTDAFPSTNLFRRRPDALFRATYTLSDSKKRFHLKPNLLFIYHLGEDSFENIYGGRESISGSDGLTLNGNLIGIYDFKSGSLSLSAAAPFVVRDIRPDGLTREFTVSVGYVGRF